MKDFSFQPSWNEKVPSPTGSEDSGLGLSPSPSTMDGTFCVESPGKPSFVIFGDNIAEDLPYNYDDSKLYISQAPEVKTNSNSSGILLPFNDQDLDGFEFLNCNELFNTSEFSNIPSSPIKKRNSKSSKKRNPTESNLSKSKFDLCLQPKTGNGKPRQTSLKRKMKPSKKNKNYSGVRPITVRERLEEIKRGKGPASVRGQSHSCSRPRCQVPYPVVSCLSPYSVSAPSPCSDSVFFSSPQDTGIPYSPPSYHPNPGIEDPGAFHSESTSSESPMTPSLYTSPHREQIAPPCSSMMNLSSPPNVTLTPNHSTCIELSTSGSLLNYIPPIDTQPNSFSAPVQHPYEPGLRYSQEQAYFVSDHCRSDAMPIPPNSLGIHQHAESDYCDAQTSNFIAFLESVYQGDIDKLEFFLERMPEFIDKPDSSGMTSLLYATKNNQLQTVQLLLGHQASPHVTQGQGGCGIFHIAVKQSSYELLDLFVKSLIPSDIERLINSRDTAAGGLTPLHIATEKRDVQIVKILLQHGADLTIQERKNGYTPLHVAVKNGDYKTVQAMLEFAKRKAQEHEALTGFTNQSNSSLMSVVNQTTFNDNTALHFAAELQSACMIQDGSIGQVQDLIINLLLECGADTSVKNHQNQLPMNLLAPSGVYSQEFERLRPGRGKNLPPRCQSTNVLNFSYPPLRQARGGSTAGSSGPFLK